MIIASRKFESACKLGGVVTGQISIELKWPGYWTVNSPDFSVSTWNPFTAVMLCLEHAAVGMAKYVRLKDQCRDQERAALAGKEK